MAGAMCVGDSASLVDPFTGEGIGNALVGKVDREFFDREEHTNGFPADQAAHYMESLWEELGNELSNSYRLQGAGEEETSDEAGSSGGPPRSRKSEKY